MTTLLHHLNSLPCEATLRHYYPLPRSAMGRGNLDLTEAKAWDLVRATESHFLIPQERTIWLRMCETRIVHDSSAGDLPSRAYDILDLLEKHGATEQLFSFGVGLAALEYHIKRLRPTLQVYCSDYSAENINRLKKIFHECDGISQFDLINEQFSKIFPHAGPKAAILIHRVDPHLSDDEWKNAFARLATDKARHILFVPHRLLTIRYLLEAKRREYWHRVLGTPLALSGMVRTMRRWLQIWGGYYELTEMPQIGYSRGFWLKLRSSPTT